MKWYKKEGQGREEDTQPLIFQVPIAADLPTLLNNYRAIIYNGQFDFICNLSGVQSIYYITWKDGTN